jgi:hypothetical protein
MEWWNDILVPFLVLFATFLIVSTVRMVTKPAKVERHPNPQYEAWLEREFGKRVK